MLAIDDHHARLQVALRQGRDRQPGQYGGAQTLPAGVAKLALVQGFGAVMLYGGVAACRAAGALKSGSRGGYNLGTLASVA